ncbi:hypothetical protein AAFG13_08295 [Bradyrhizobium sp. B124]|uniref:hypothetical protein n=1 Tax=Bradyrhizobium sp. B124 TaxID=3140245 RepID=UPI00318339A6
MQEMMEEVSAAAGCGDDDFWTEMCVSPETDANWGGVMIQAECAQDDHRWHERSLRPEGLSKWIRNDL